MVQAMKPVTDEQKGREGSGDFHHKHHRIARHRPRIELLEGIADRRDQDGGVQYAAGLFGHLGSQKKVPACIARCSTMGPSDKAGKKVKPPTIRMTPIKSPTNSPPWVG